ncbi:MAG: S8 family serine peptidase [bacterium]
MSSQIGQELRSLGIAKVLVYLKKPVAAGAPRWSAKTRRDLRRHFIASPLSQAGALARAGLGARRIPGVILYPGLGILLGTVTREGLAGLKAEKEAVVRVTGAPSVSLIRPTHAEPAKLTRGVTWGIEKLGVPQLWKQGLTGKGVLVGHLDTGIDGRHPALKGAIKGFAEFDLMGRLKRPSPGPHDTGDHGTHTAATIAGRAVAGRSVGVAPGAMLAGAIVIEDGDVVARVLGGMDWAVTSGARVLSMSLGFRGWRDDFTTLVDRLRALNVLPVFAVGNEGPGTSRSPGNYWQALSVGAVDRELRVADFSSSQQFKRARDPVVPDLVAPGVDVVSARPGVGWQAMDGTSMATPHIAGLAALLLEAKPKARASDIESAIFKSCRPGPGMDPTRGNRGIPDARRALDALVKT